MILQRFFLFSIFIALLLFWVNSNVNPSLNESNDQDTLKTNYLELNGVIRESRGTETEKDKPLEGVQIKVSKDDKPLYIFFTNKKGKVDIKLLLQSKYVLEVYKEGYVTKRIEVNTKINRVAIPEKKQKAYYEFPFAVDIFEEVRGLDASVLNKPIAKIGFSYSTFSFEYDASYTNKINTELKKMYKDYYALLKMQLDSIINKDGAEPEDKKHAPKKGKDPKKD